MPLKSERSTQCHPLDDTGELQEPRPTLHLAQFKQTRSGLGAGGRQAFETGFLCVILTILELAL